MSRGDRKDDNRSIVVRHVSKTFTLRYHRTLKQMSVAMMRQQELWRIAHAAAPPSSAR